MPCLTLAEQCKQQDPTCNVLFFSSTKPIDLAIINGNKNIDHHIPLPCSYKRTWYYLPLIIPLLVWATMKSTYYLLKHKPIQVVSTGSIVAIPVCIASWILRIPIHLYELNAKPGKAMQALAHLATTIHVCFEQTKKLFPKKHCQLIPYPARFSKEQTAALPFEIESNRVTLFVQGGSQGSLSINTHMQKLIETYQDLAPHIQIIHQTGANTDKDWKSLYQHAGIPAHTFAYEYNIAHYYQKADLIICRSGAGALFETVFFEKSCVTIPLETTQNNHQLYNALAIVAQHPNLFCMVRQHEDVPAKLYKEIKARIPHYR